MTRQTHQKIVEAGWKVHTPNLLMEIMNNPGTGILHVPINIFGKLLAEVAERAIALDDTELNALVIRLTLYSTADPTSPDYNERMCREVMVAAREKANTRLTAIER